MKTTEERKEKKVVRWRETKGGRRDRKYDMRKDEERKRRKDEK